MKAATNTDPSVAGADSSRQSPDEVFLRKIVVPVDFSAPSLKALDYAQAIAQKIGATVHILHVVEPTPFMSSLKDLPIVLSESEEAKHWEAMMHKLAHQRSRLGGHVKSEVRIGKPADEIVAIASDMEADLLVTSTHGRTGLKHVMLGSTAERIVRHARCPVLVVRAHQEEGREHPKSSALVPFHKILVPTDFSPRAQVALRYAGTFAATFGGELILLHCIYFPGGEMGIEYQIYDTAVLVEASTKAAEGAMATLLQENVPSDVRAHGDVRIGPPLGEIPEAARNIDADLIVCATHGYTGLKHALLGSTAEGVVRHSPCPVLVVPERVQQGD